MKAKASAVLNDQFWVLLCGGVVLRALFSKMTGQIAMKRQESPYMFRTIIPAAIFALYASNALASPVPEFYCDVPADLEAGKNFEGFGLVTGNIYYLNPESQGAAFTAYPEDGEFLPQVPAGSGVRYNKAGIDFHYKADNGTLTLPDGRSFSCLSAEMKHPTARSMGGSIIRSKPDISGDIITRLKDGGTITINKETGSFYDGWQWVEVEVDLGEYGYIWGGTICTTSREITGVGFNCQ